MQGIAAKSCTFAQFISFLHSMRILSKGILFISTDNVIHMTCKYLSQLSVIWFLLIQFDGALHNWS